MSDPSDYNMFARFVREQQAMIDNAINLSGGITGRYLAQLQEEYAAQARRVAEQIRSLMPEPSIMQGIAEQVRQSQEMAAATERAISGMVLPEMIEARDHDLDALMSKMFERSEVTVWQSKLRIDAAAKLFAEYVVSYVRRKGHRPALMLSSHDIEILKLKALDEEWIEVTLAGGGRYCAHYRQFGVMPCEIIDDDDHCPIGF